MKHTVKDSELLADDEFLLEKYPGKGGWTYVIIPNVSKSGKGPLRWLKVKGRIDHFEFYNYKLMPLGNGQLFLPVKASIRKQIGKKDGDHVRIVLFEDHTPTEIPEDLLTCLKDSPSLLKRFRGYSDGEHKMFADWINSAKTDRTKVVRIARTLSLIEKGLRFKDKDMAL